MRETLNAMALAQMAFYKPAELTRLYNEVGSATAIVDNRKDLRALLPTASDKLVEAAGQLDRHLERAKRELDYCCQHAIEAIDMGRPRYPHRLRQCADAPLVVFLKGNADLNHDRVLSVVGTRRMTNYGRDAVERLMTDLRSLCPGVLVVSGLAYGVDVCAHRAALNAGFPTLGVLAHGLDTLYPYAHRQTAEKMVEQGGLLTEYFTGTRIDKANFVRRNRIVAGLCDGCLLVESADTGGGLITCRMAFGYDREVFALPGRLGDPFSQGCNNLIARQEAHLLTSAGQIADLLGWQTAAETEKARSKGIERELFPQLTDDEQVFVGLLADTNDQRPDQLAAVSGLTIQQVRAMGFALEMRGLVRLVAGGAYHLIS